MLLFLIIYAYAIVGMQLFSTILQNTYNPINYYYHFRNFLSTIFLLYRVINGEKWYELMEECANANVCSPPSVLGCSFSISYAYFISFVSIINIFLTNIIISIIVRSFEYLTKDNSKQTKYSIYKFIDVLKQFDSTGS
ncbi:hypothetical protein HZS_609 [Henneguya salminicola]|nr:hypothetical protein HZS_609 [Henneguya salminicola]